MKPLPTTLLLHMLIAANTPAFAGFAGADPFDFLLMESGARQSAIGGAFVSGSNDANVLAYNPAGLGAMERNHMSFMHTSHFEGVAREHAAVGLQSGLGASIDFLRYGPVSRTTLSNPSGAGAEGFTPTALVAAIGFGRPLGHSWRLGGAAKYARQEIDGIAASAYALDAGVQTLLLENPGVILGVSLQNFGTRAKFQATSESLPQTVRSGGALRTSLLGLPLGLSIDLDKASGRDLVIHAGAEATVLEALALRLGYNTRNEAGPGVSFGFGVVHSGFSFDYALVPFGVLGTSHQISLGLQWGDWSIR